MSPQSIAARSFWWHTLLVLWFSFLPMGVRSQVGEDAVARRTPVLLGAHYYPWYRAASSKDGATRDRGWLAKALRGRLVPRQLPALGVYDSRDAAVIGTHIQQSLRAGIDFWSVSWWGPESREDVAFREHILKHPEASKLRYAVLYESTGRLGTFRKPDYDNWLPDFDYLNKEYFDHPYYLKIGPRPVVFVYLTREYFRDRGLDALKRLREVHPEVYIVGDDVFGPRYRAQDAQLFDAVFAYDVYGQSLAAEGATQAGIDRLKRNYSHAKEIANGVGTAFVPAISPGYNDRAVRQGHVGRARTLSDRKDSREGDLFREMIRQVALPLVDAQARNMVLVTSFNEWYEDTQIEPTAGTEAPSQKDDSESGQFFSQGQTYVDYGRLYLDLLRKELSGGEGSAGELKAPDDNVAPKGN